MQNRPKLTVSCGFTSSQVVGPFKLRDGEWCKVPCSRNKSGQLFSNGKMQETCFFCRTEFSSLPPWWKELVERTFSKQIIRQRWTLWVASLKSRFNSIWLFCDAGPKKKSIEPSLKLESWWNLKTECVKFYKIFRHTCCKVQWLISDGS